MTLVTLVTQRREEKKVHKKNKKKEIILDSSHDAPLLPPLPQDIWEPSVSDAAVNQMLGTWWNDFGGAVSAAGFTAPKVIWSSAEFFDPTV